VLGFTLRTLAMLAMLLAFDPKNSDKQNLYNFYKTNCIFSLNKKDAHIYRRYT
jgi:hypothetical protein